MGDTIKERTLEFIKYKNISVKEFETRCGLSNGYVTAMRKGYGADKLNNVLTAYPELNRDWLLYNEGEMLNAHEVVEVTEHGTPVYDLDVTCGGRSRPIVFADEHIIGHVNLPNVSPTAAIIRANGVSERTIQNWEWGKTSPRPHHVKAIERLLTDNEPVTFARLISIIESQQRVIESLTHEHNI